MMFRCSRLFTARQARQHGHGAMSIRALHAVRSLKRSGAPPSRLPEDGKAVVSGGGHGGGLLNLA